MRLRAVRIRDSNYGLRHRHDPEHGILRHWLRTLGKGADNFRTDSHFPVTKFVFSGSIR